MLRLSLSCLAILSAALGPAAANDGFGGLSATGLHFSQTDAVALLEEDLFLSRERVEVSYRFRNLTDQDVTGEVIFPLPPVFVWSSWYGMMNLPDDLGAPDLVNFTVTVDGTPVAFSIDRIAVIEDPWDEERPLSVQYDNPGRDVTADLAQLGLPLTLDFEAVNRALFDLGPDQRAIAVAAGLAEFYDGDPVRGILPDVYGNWSIVTRYHWTQTFPAGQDLLVRHTYDNRPPGGLFHWDHPAHDDDLLTPRYCIDDSTSRGMARILQNAGDPDYGNLGLAYFMSYVLRTANSWAGPIGRFRLTLDKGDAGNILSLCASGVRKTGPTTFVIEKTDYTPDRDLEILLVTPIPR